MNIRKYLFAQFLLFCALVAVFSYSSQLYSSERSSYSDLHTYVTHANSDISDNNKVFESETLHPTQKPTVIPLYNFTLPRRQQPTIEKEICDKDLKNTMKPPEEGTYQTVIEGETWISSAHVDTRLVDVVLVRLFGVSLGVTKVDTRIIYCQLWDENGHLMAFAFSHLMSIYKFGFKTESYQAECEFKTTIFRSTNYLISVASSPCIPPNNTLIINDNSKVYRKRVNYTVCISGPTKYNYSDHQRLIEWMEFNQILGAGRTIIYNVESSPKVLDVFNIYKNKGLLEVYNVNPPYINDDNRWIENKNEDPAYAKMSMRHDCLMREMFRTKYVVFLDLDESIVPRYHEDYTWDDMLNTSNCAQDSYIMARNVFFRRDWGVDNEVESNADITDSYRLLSLMTTVRDSSFFPKMTRSKYFVRPEQVRAASTHRAFMYSDAEPCVLDTQIGALHHYKYRPSHIESIEHTRDRTMEKYKSELLTHVKKLYSDLKE